jgi:hypothetical protein
MTWIEGLRSELATVIGMLIPVLIASAFAFFVWGLVTFLYHSGDEARRIEGKNKIIWGLLALFSLIAIWGIVELLQRMFDTSSPAVSPVAPKALYGS